MQIGGQPERKTEKDIKHAKFITKAKHNNNNNNTDKKLQKKNKNTKTKIDYRISDPNNYVKLYTCFMVMVDVMHKRTSQSMSCRKIAAGPRSQ